MGRYYQAIVPIKRSRKGLFSPDEFLLSLSYTCYYGTSLYFNKYFLLTKEGLDPARLEGLRETVAGWWQETFKSTGIQLEDPDAATGKVLVGLEELIRVGDVSVILDVGVYVTEHEKPSHGIVHNQDLGEPEYSSEDLGEPGSPDEDSGSGEEPEYRDEDLGGETEYADERLDGEPLDEAEEPNLYEGSHEAEYNRDEDMEEEDEDEPMYPDSDADEGIVFNGYNVDGMEIEQEPEVEEEEEDEAAARAKFEWVKELVIGSGVCVEKISEAKAPLLGGCCAICFDEFEDNVDDYVFVLHCSHIFHVGCLVPSIVKGNYSCPSCRHPILDPDLLC